MVSVVDTLNLKGIYNSTRVEIFAIAVVDTLDLKGYLQLVKCFFKSIVLIL